MPERRIVFVTTELYPETQGGAGVVVDALARHLAGFRPVLVLLATPDPVEVMERDGVEVEVALIPAADFLERSKETAAALGCSWISVSGSRARWPAILCLLALSVPVIASLQFYAGYPMRTVTASGATWLLNLFGIEATRTGTSMVAYGRTVLVDAPCSGVRMLWTACVLCASLAAIRTRVSWRAMAMALAGVFPIAEKQR